jgi:2-dehydro-3-deoxygalactonokinase
MTYRRSGAHAERVIGVDWGTSSFRAYLMDSSGTVEDQRSADLGILRVPESDFEAAFEAQLRPWLDAWPDAPVVMSGMIGSRQGWAEAPYVECPVGIEDLARGMTVLTTRTGRQVSIVPGVKWSGRDGVPDVMRGEETQVFGALEPASQGRQLFVLPGTHSKWAEVEEGRIESFATHMTGEVFAVLSEHSILGTLMERTGDDSDAFLLGVERAGTAGGLLHHLFGVRTLGLFGDVPASGLRSYLSGLLIGHEAIAAAGEAARVDGGVRVIASEALAELYSRALAALGTRATVTSGAVTARGLSRIAAMRTSEGTPA